jgi:hypothetical protein
MLAGENEKNIDLFDMYVIESKKNKKSQKNKNLNINDITCNFNFEEITLQKNKPICQTLLESPQSQFIDKSSNEFSILSSNSSISENSAVHIDSISNVSFHENKSEDQDYGFWNNIKKNLNDIKNKLKFNLLQTDTKINFEDYDIIQIYENKFFTSDYYNTEIETSNDIEKLNKYVTKEIFWLSYRSNFQPIIFNKNAYTSDAGWGCMIRAGQMILAKALYEISKNIEHKNSKLYSVLDSISDSKNLFFNILLLFGENTLNYKHIHNLDFFSFFKNSYEVTPPFSIRNILNCGIKINKGAGEWFSDIEIIKILQELNTKYSPIQNLKIIHFTDGIVNIDFILDKCFKIKKCNCKFTRISYGYDKAKDFDYRIRNKKELNQYNFSKNFPSNIINSISDLENDYIVIESEEVNQKQIASKNKDPECKCFQNCIFYYDNYYEMTYSFILFISLRLGLNKLEECYYDSIIDFFDLKNNIGMIGGKGTRALYFIGHTENKLIFLDPHYVQESVDLFNTTGSSDEKSKLNISCSNSSNHDVSVYNNYKSYIPQDFMTVDLDKMTPSLTLGFCFSNCQASDFLSFIEHSIQMSKRENFLFRISNRQKKKGK